VTGNTLGGLTPPTTSSLFVIKINPTAPLATRVTWVADFPNSNLGTAKPGLVSDLDELVVVTSFLGSIARPPAATLTTKSGGKSDGVVIRLNKGDGSVLWAKGIGGTEIDDAVAVAVDVGTNIWVTGSIQGTAEFGALQATSAGGSDAYLARYSATGEELGVFAYGDSANQEGRQLAFDSTGGLVWAGQFRGNINFGAGALTASGQDLFLVRFRP
jgi:hypothetical protein